jgi:hypothetical protein
MIHHFFKNCILINRYKIYQKQKSFREETFLFLVYIICIKISFKNIYLFVDKIVCGIVPTINYTHLMQSLATT